MKAEPLTARLPAGVLGAVFVILWSTGYPAARIALDHFGPFTLLLLRFGVAGAIYAALASLGTNAWPRGRAAVHSAVSGLLSLGLQFACLYWAVTQGVNVGLIALVIGTMPIVTALLGLAFGEAVRPLQWVGFAFGFGGVAMAVAQGIGPGHGAGGAAYLAVLGGLLAISAGTLYQKRLGSEVDLRGGLAVQHLAAALLVLPFAAHEGLRFDTSAAAVASLAWVILINSLTAFGLFFVLLRRGAVNRVTALFFLMPPVTALIDYLVLGDRLTALKVLGIAVAAFGVYLATRQRPAPPARSARGERQLAAQPERPANEEATQLLAAVHHREPVLGEARQRAAAVREQPVEKIDCGRHRGNLALAPSLVGPQHAERAGILAGGSRRRHGLRERRRIEQAEVDALPGERMHDVRGIADERDALRDVARCGESAERERHPLARESRAPQSESGSAIERVGKLAVRG